MKWRPFQRRIIRAVESEKYDVVVASLPRAQGKSTLAAHLCFRALTPGDKLYRAGTESHLVAATLDSSRKTCFKQLRRLIEDSDSADDFRIAESRNACSVTRKDCNTRVSVVASTARATLGLVGCPLVVVDEPGSYELEAGADLWASLSTALGKPDSDLKLFLIGHLAPKATRPGHWYYDLVHRGTTGRTWVYFLQGRRNLWEKAAEIRRCSPLSWAFKKSRAKLLEQRDAARSDGQALAAFLSLRMNLPAADESTVLLSVGDWERITARPVPEAIGRPVVGLDLGGGRAWSAAVACWPNGRVEAFACAPGVPDLGKQERRDGVPPGTYQKLADAGVLHVADGLLIPPARMVLGLASAWMPRAYLLDRWRIDELRDAKPKVPVIPRVPGWKHGGQDVRGLRRIARDGALAFATESQPLLKASLSVARVENDDQGNTRPAKSGTNNKARDDVAYALMLAAAAVARMKPRGQKAAAVVCG